MTINLNGLLGSSNLRNLDQTTKDLKISFNRLSSGKRINSGADDPAGLAVSTLLQNQADLSGTAAQNISDGVSISNIADGALSSVSDITSRLSELATQASNGTLSSEQRGALNQEFQSLKSELDRVSNTTEFNGQQLLSGNGASFDLQVGTDQSSNSQISLKTIGVSSQSLGLAGADISTQSGAQAALDLSKTAVNQVSQARGDIGATANRLDTAFNNLKVSQENLASSASAIRDVDFAAQTAQFAAQRISQQKNIALAAQTNSLASNVLRLIS